ncbi:SapC family protein [Desulfovibrionales bacterium]
MSTIVPVSQDRHAGLRWKRPASYAFAARQTVAPLVAAELPKAVLMYPISFIEQEEKLIPVALLGVHAERNLFVAADGRWLAPYIPVIFRTQPFCLGKTEDGQQILCINEEQGLAHDGAGEDFFANNQPTEAVAEVMHLLTQTEQNRLQTIAACTELLKYGVVHPWPITLKTGTEEKQITGLLKIDEAALNALDEDAFLALRRAGSLPIAYCQLVSMQHIAQLGKLAAAHELAAQHKPAPSQAAPIQLNTDNDMLSFDNL